MLGLPIRKKAKDVPWGYRLSKEDPTTLEPIEDHLRLLYQANLYLKDSSALEVAKWLSVNTQSHITSEGLARVLSTRPPCRDIQLSLKERTKKFHDRQDY